jgi:DNA-binding NtrC family response regulator
VDAKRNKKILVVDDEPLVSWSIKQVLSSDGFEVDCVGSGLEALRLSDSGNYDLFIMDIKMPGMTGLEVLEEIKKRNAEVKVIVVTGYSYSSNTENAKQLGAFAIINKPFSIEEITGIVRKALGA